MQSFKVLNFFLSSAEKVPISIKDVSELVFEFNLSNM